jgi:hypothetical protein
MNTPVARTYATIVSVCPLPIVVTLTTFPFPSCSQVLWAVVQMRLQLQVLRDQIILAPSGDVVNQFLLSFWRDILFSTRPFRNSIVSQLAT